MRVELAIEAREDILAGAAFYGRRSLTAAEHFVACVFDDLAALEQHAGVHERTYGWYRKKCRRFPFAIYYDVEPDIVFVAAVLDCRQRPASIRRRLHQQRDDRDAE